jgi:hypothetical protein
LTVCVALADPLVTTIAAVRADVSPFTGTLYDTAPGPVPPVPLVIVANPPADADHWQVGPVTTLKVLVPPCAEIGADDAGSTDTVHVGGGGGGVAPC